MVHESVGHPQEADRIVGREAAQAGESYLNLKDLGMKIGSEEAYVSDDPTIPHSLGFYLYDEEGVKAKKRRLIHAGKLNEFLHNRHTANLLGLNSNAAARASRFDREPIIRMANTYVEPGDYKVEELFKDVKKGIYVKSFMEWNIDDKRLNQRYVGHEAYMIENGEISEMVRNPVIEITTPKLWSSLDARADDLQFSAATCGKGDPLQGVPVWSGGPHIRFREVRIGFR
jgi:TldD protein